MQFAISSACVTPPGDETLGDALNSLVENLGHVRSSNTAITTSLGVISPLAAMADPVVLTDAQLATMSEQGRLMDLWIFASGVQTSSSGNGAQFSSRLASATVSEALDNAAKLFGVYNRPQFTAANLLSTVADRRLAAFCFPSVVGYTVDVIPARREVQASFTARPHRVRLEVLSIDGESGTAGISVTVLGFDTGEGVLAEEQFTLHRVGHIITPQSFRGAYIGSGSTSDEAAASPWAGNNGALSTVMGIVGCVPQLIPTQMFLDTLDPEYYEDDDSRFGSTNLRSGPEATERLVAAADLMSTNVDGVDHLRVSRGMAWIYSAVRGDNLTDGVNNAVVSAGLLTEAPISSGSGAEGSPGVCQVTYPGEPTYIFPADLQQIRSDLVSPGGPLASWQPQLSPTVTMDLLPEFVPYAAFIGDEFAAAAQEVPQGTTRVTFFNTALSETVTEDVTDEELGDRLDELAAAPNVTTITVTSPQLPSSGSPGRDSQNRLYFTALTSYVNGTLEAAEFEQPLDSALEWTRFWAAEVGAQIESTGQQIQSESNQ